MTIKNVNYLFTIFKYIRFTFVNKIIIISEKKIEIHFISIAMAIQYLMN